MPRAFQVGEQRGDRLVGLRGLAHVVFLDVGVGVPLLIAGAAARDDADESHAILDELTSEQASCRP